MQILIANFQTLFAFKTGNFAYMLDQSILLQKNIEFIQRPGTISVTLGLFIGKPEP